jgi:hypothetical protein
MAQGANGRGGSADPLKKSAGARSETPCGVLHKPDLLQGASRGGAERLRAADGQVRGGLAMLLAGSRWQPGCFLAQTVQAPFVFCSVHCRTLTGGTLAREHPTTQPYVLAQVRLLERPFRSEEAARAASICTPGARAGCWELPAGTAQRARVTGAAKAYTGKAAARPPGRWAGAEVLLTRTLPTDSGSVRVWPGRASPGPDVRVLSETRRDSDSLRRLSPRPREPGRSAGLTGTWDHTRCSHSALSA